jgi:HK97 family phage prohead protease
MIERKTFSAELKAAPDGGGFEGLAACFKNVDDSCWPDVLAPGCFVQDLPSFLSEGFCAGINHSWDEPIGKPIEARETAEGLWVKVAISDTTAGRDVRTLLKDGVISRLSIGFRVLAKQWLETPQEVRSWWDAHAYTPSEEDVLKSANGVRLVTRVKLYECSPVAVPANKRAVIASVKDGGAGNRLTDHAETVLATVSDFIDRLGSLKGIREAEGRGLTHDHRVLLKRLHGQLTSLMDEPDLRARTHAGLEVEQTLARLKMLGL